MKRILIFIFFLLSLFSLCSFYFQKVSEEKEVLQKAITNHSEIVIFSEKNIIAGNKQRKEEIVRAIKKLSASYHVNVYKNDVTNTGNASVLFAKINFNTKKIFKKLQMSIPENQERFKLQSKGLLYSNNEYILKDFNQLTRSNVLSGRYIIQYQKKSAVISFCKNLQKELNIQIDIQEESSKYSPNYLFEIINIIIIITLVMVVLFFYYLSYRNNTIKSYFGYSDLRLVNDIYTSFLPNIILMFIITILFVLFLLNKGIQIAIILELIVQFWLSSIIFVAISYLLVVFFIKISSKDWLSFKGKKPLKSVLLVGIIFLYCITPLIIFGLTETVPLAKENIMLAVNKKRNKKILKHYFYLPLLSAGVDSENEEQLVPSFQAHTKLVNQFYKEGLLLCRPEDSTRDRLNGNKYEKDYSSNEIWVSPNYLNNAFVEVKGLDGKKIKINNNEKQLVVLIPEKLKNSMKKIRDYYKQSHSFYDFEVAQEFSKETLKKQTSTIKFILIKNNPKLLFFKERDSKIKNPILRVLTPNNIQKNSSVYADTIIGEPDYFFVKDQGNLKNVIENKDVYKEFPVQIDAYEYLMSTAQEDVQMLLILFFIVSGLIVLYYIITYFFSNAFITMYSKKFKLNILFGFSLRKVMALYLLVFSVPWTAIFLFSPTKEILISICFILLGSFIISFVNLKKIYRNLNDLE